MTEKCQTQIKRQSTHYLSSYSTLIQGSLIYEIFGISLKEGSGYVKPILNTLHRPALKGKEGS